jgi:hypothetical protein
MMEMPELPGSPELHHGRGRSGDLAIGKVTVSIGNRFWQSWQF